jgi:hypothetical protein
MKKHLLILAALTLVGCGLLDSDEKVGAQDPRITYSGEFQPSDKVSSDFWDDRRYYVALNPGHEVKLDDTVSAYIYHWPDSTVIQFFRDTVTLSSHTLPPTACSATIDAVGKAAGGTLSLNFPLVFLKPTTPYRPFIDTAASAASVAPFTIGWNELPVSGTYTIDCPDPR